MVENNDKKVLLVVEIKGVDKKSELCFEEEWKILIVKKFFEVLKK